MYVFLKAICKHLYKFLQGTFTNEIENFFVTISIFL